MRIRPRTELRQDAPSDHSFRISSTIEHTKCRRTLSNICPYSPQGTVVISTPSALLSLAEPQRVQDVCRSWIAAVNGILKVAQHGIPANCTSNCLHVVNLNDNGTLDAVTGGLRSPAWSTRQQRHESCSSRRSSPPTPSSTRPTGVKLWSVELPFDHQERQRMARNFFSVLRAQQFPPPFLSASCMPCHRRLVCSLLRTTVSGSTAQAR